MAQVKDGLRDPAPADRTLDQLADYWVKHRVPLKRSGQDDISILNRHLRPAFGPLKLKDIGRAEGDRSQLERMNLDPKTVANHLTLLIAMMDFAYLYKRCYPILVFAWGDCGDQYKTIQAKRSFIWGGIFLSLLVGVLGNLFVVGVVGG